MSPPPRKKKRSQRRAGTKTRSRRKLTVAISPTSSREKILERVREEVSDNQLWRHFVGRRWLCPYCGDMVKLPKDSEEGQLSAIVDHLIASCPSWAHFQGQTLPLKVLKGKRLALTIDRKLRNDPAWQQFDQDGYWHCPYSMQRVRMPSRDPQAIRQAIRDHLAHNHAFNSGRSKPHSVEKLKAAVDRANSIGRLMPRVAEILNSDPRWQVMALDGSWVCPFCEERVKNIDVSTPLMRSETAPRPVAEHLMTYCATYQKVQMRNKEGELIPPENLVRITNFIERRRERKRRKTEAKEAKTRQITAADLGSDGVISIDGSSTQDTAKKKEDVWGGDADRKHLYAGRLDETGSRRKIVASDGFELSVDIEEEELSTWDPLMREDAERVTERPLARSTPVPQLPAAPAPELPPAEPPAAAEAARAAEPAGADAIDAERQRIQQEAIARARRSLMAMISPIPRLEGYELGAVFRPRSDLGTDFFQFFDRGDGRVLICAWEASKSGMDMVPITRHFLELLKRAVEQHDSPKQILTALNTAVHDSTAEDIYLNVLLIEVDGNQHKLRLCNAGFQPPWRYNQFRNPDLEAQTTNGIVLGSDEGSLFGTLLEQAELDIDPQDLVVAHSQGAAGWIDHAGQKVDLDRFRDFIREHGRQDASYFLSMTDAEYKRLRGGAPISRDLTVLAVKRL